MRKWQSVLSILCLLIAIGLGGYVLAQWIRTPSMTEMQVYFRFWPHLLIAGVLAVVAGIIKP